MSAALLISRLEKARATGRGSWICRCPAHEDKSPSLTVRELDDGRILLHCFAGCEVSQVVEAVGMSLGDLFPPKPLADRLAPLRRPFPAADVLEAVMGDALIVQQVANGVQKTAQVTPHQRTLLQLAIARISAARDLACG